MKIDTPLTPKPPEARPASQKGQSQAQLKQQDRARRESFRDLMKGGQGAVRAEAGDRANGSARLVRPSGPGASTVKTTTLADETGSTTLPEALSSNRAFGFSELGLFGLGHSLSFCAEAQPQQQKPSVMAALASEPTHLAQPQDLPKARSQILPAAEIATAPARLAGVVNGARPLGEEPILQALAVDFSMPEASSLEAGGAEALSQGDLDADLHANLTGLTGAVEAPASFMIAQQDGRVMASLAAPELDGADGERLRDLLEQSLADLGLVLTDLTLNGAPVAVRLPLHGVA